MFYDDALVIYKGKPAIVKECSDGKFYISLADGTKIKVRDKDIELLHPGPVKKFDEIKEVTSDQIQAVREAWELLSDEGAPVSLKEAAAIIFGRYTPHSAYAVYSLLQDGLYFSGSIAQIVPRSKNDITAAEAKRSDKLHEAGERAQFLDRIKTGLKKSAASAAASVAASVALYLPTDARFIQDVEALAYGKSVKSRTMKDLGLSETPEEAHALLLKTGFWTNAVNPYPSRFGISLNSASICPDAPPEEERRDLCHLAAFAIDSPWSNDPDDALSIEKCKEGSILYVHIADPASSVMPGSPAEQEARNRGATLYLPETIVRMLAEESLPVFALGLSEKSPALTFKITIDKDGAVSDTEIFPSLVKVRRITYEDADREIDTLDTADDLRALEDVSIRILKRREANGAVNIELPEAHISVKDGVVDIQPIVKYRSASIVKECMIVAGESAGLWAAGRGFAFPYISQEADIPGTVLSGLAGSLQLRRCMRPRVHSVKPGRHQGHGLDIYAQVTSPLRRYNDLLAHMQIRAILHGNRLLSADEISTRLGFCEAAISAAVQAERASYNHWNMVYLMDKKDCIFDAVALEKKGNRTQVIIPSLAMETQVAFQKDVSPNENVKITLKSVNIPRGEAVFV